MKLFKGARPVFTGWPMKTAFSHWRRWEGLACLFGIFLASSQSGSGAPGATAPKAVSCTMVDYASSPAGRVNVFFTDDALRINLGSKRVYLVAKAPDWKVIMFNAGTNKGIQFSKEQWAKHIARWNYFVQDNWPGDCPVIKNGTSTRLGLPVSTYEIADLNGRKRRSFSQYTVAEYKALPPTSSMILERMMHVPQVPGLPMEMLMGKPSTEKLRGLQLRQGGEAHFLKLLMLKKGTAAASDFDYPKNFKQAKNEIDVVMNDDSRNDDIQAFFGDK